MRVCLRRFLGWAIALFCATAGTLCAEPAAPAFVDALSPAERSATGVEKLSAGQRAALDTQIAREIALARQGDVVAFAKPFSERRTPEQKASTGVALLSDPERAQLDAVIARSVARRPLPMVGRLSNKLSQKNDDVVETVTYRPQLHGEFTLAYGMGSGDRSFYGGSLTTTYVDPARRFSVSLTYAEYHSKGYFPCEFGEPIAFAPLADPLR